MVACHQPATGRYLHVRQEGAVTFRVCAGHFDRIGAGEIPEVVAERFDLAELDCRQPQESVPTRLRSTHEEGCAPGVLLLVVDGQLPHVAARRHRNSPAQGERERQVDWTALW